MNLSPLLAAGNCRIASVLLCAVIAAASAADYAGQSGTPPPVEESRTLPEVDIETYEALGAINDAALTEETLPSARRLVEGLLSSGHSLNGYEAALAHEAAGRICWQMGDLPASIEHFRSALADPLLIPVELERKTLYSLGQLYFRSQKYEPSVEALVRWLAMEERPTPQQYFFVAVANSKVKNWAEAVEFCDKAMSLATEAEKEIPRNWWNLAYSARYSQNKFHSAVRILEKAVVQYPSQDYWLWLADLYGRIKNHEKRRHALEQASLLRSK